MYPKLTTCNFLQYSLGPETAHFAPPGGDPYDEETEILLQKVRSMERSHGSFGCFTQTTGRI